MHCLRSSFHASPCTRKPLNTRQEWEGRTLLENKTNNQKHLVDLRPKLLRDLRLLGLHELAHHAEDVLPPLRPSVCHVQVVEGHVLHDLRTDNAPLAKQTSVAIVLAERGRNKERVAGVCCWCVAGLHAVQSVREKERERQRETERDRETERQREREREREERERESIATEHQSKPISRRRRE